jgi:hypothetical protein
MAWKLIYTSAPRLLQAGRSGFGTVARHREIPPLVVESAEKSSQFSRQTGLDPARVIFSYRVARSSAGNFHLFTRISDAGTDYSGRTNHLAEHLILTEQEAARLGAEGYTPAGAMLAYEWGGYEGQARWLGDEDLWQPNATDANTGGSHWQAATADANRVNLLASAEAQSGVVLEYPSHYQSEAHPWILWLFAESQCLCPRSGWGITFTTNAQPTDSLSDFRWLGVPDNSSVLHKLQGSGRPILNFTSPAPQSIALDIAVKQPTAAMATSSEAVPASERPASIARVAARKPQPKRPVAIAKTETNRWPLIVFLALSPLVLISVGFLFYALGRGPARAPSEVDNIVGDQLALTPQQQSDFQSTPPPAVPHSSPSGAGEVKALDERASAESASKGKETDLPADRAENLAPTDSLKNEIQETQVKILFPSDYKAFSWAGSIDQKGVVYSIIEDGVKQLLNYRAGQTHTDQGTLYLADDITNEVIAVSAESDDEVRRPVANKTKRPLILQVEAPNQPIQKFYLLSKEAALKGDADLPIDQLKIANTSGLWRLDAPPFVSRPELFKYDGAPAVEFRIVGSIKDPAFKETLDKTKNFYSASSDNPNIPQLSDTHLQRLTDLVFIVRESNLGLFPSKELGEAVERFREVLREEQRLRIPTRTVADHLNDYRDTYEKALSSIRDIAKNNELGGQETDGENPSALAQISNDFEENQPEDALVALSRVFLNEVDKLIPSDGEEKDAKFNEYYKEVRDYDASKEVAYLWGNVKKALQEKSVLLQKQRAEFGKIVTLLHAALTELKLRPPPQQMPRLESALFDDLTHYMTKYFGDASQSVVLIPDVSYKLEARRVGGDWYPLADGMRQVTSKPPLKSQQ